MSTKLVFGQDARSKMQEGANKLASAVAPTFGPKGSHVTIQKEYGPSATTIDGVTVAKAIELEDPEENQGAQLLKSASEKTNKECGDGTTTVIMLARAIINEGLQRIRNGADLLDIKNGIKKATDSTIATLDEEAIPVKTNDDIKNVATISSKDKEVGELIAKTLEDVGENGIITVEKGNTPGISSDVVSGLQIDTGYASQYFVNDIAKMASVLESASVLVTDQKIETIMQLQNLFKDFMDAGKTSIAIIADGFSEEVLSTLILNKVNAILNVVAIKAPSFGESKEGILQDIAVATGANFVTSKSGGKLEDITLEDLGGVEKLTVTLTNSLFIGGAGNKEAIDKQEELIKGLLARAESTFEIEELKSRLARLTGGVGVIKIGAYSDVEQQEIIDRIEDAIGATTAAMDGGIIVGGGVAYVNASKKLSELDVTKGESIGVDIIKEALLAPLKQLAKNSGKSVSNIVEIALANSASSTDGVDFVEDTYCDLLANGVIDPVKTVKLSLQNAVSVALMILSTDVLITINKKEIIK